VVGSEASPDTCLSRMAADLLDCPWIGWVEHSLVAGSAPCVKAGERRR
jgi:hypothetical protein